MAASLFQLCGVFWSTLGFFLVVTGTPMSKGGRLPHHRLDLDREADTVSQTNLRFIAARRGSNITLNCFSNSMANWYKETEEGKYQDLMNDSRVKVTRNASMVMIKIEKIQYADSGIYFCESNNSYKSRKTQQNHCGTELRVMGISTFDQVQNRHTLKDAIIVIQSVLLVLFVSIPLLLTLGKGESKDASGEDHTYEGLTVELADTYEDIGTYQDRAEKRDFGEHPCEE